MTEDEKSALTKMLHELIIRSVPKVSYLAKYGGVLYTLKPKEKEGQFCGVFIYNDHVTLDFSQGSRLRDRTGILQGRGKSRRHVKFYSIEELPVKTIAAFLKQAAKY